MSILFFERLQNITRSTYPFETEPFLTFNKKGVYEIWCIGAAGQSNYRGSNWGLYVSGAGGLGGSGSVIRTRIYLPYDGKYKLYFLLEKRACIFLGSNPRPEDSVVDRTWGFYMNAENGTDGGKGENAGAFVWRPEKGSPGIGGKVNTFLYDKNFGGFNITDLDLTSNCIYWTQRGVDGNTSGDRTEASIPTQIPIENLGPDGGKYITPQYFPSGGQDAYADYDPSDGTLCLGNAGGAQGDGDSGVGASADGGIIVEDLEMDVPLTLYKGDTLSNNIYLGDKRVTPYTHI